MKKIIPVLICIICIGLGIFAYMQRRKSDRTAPVITFSDELIYGEDMDEKELLADVTAVDESDGDVSDTLVIETITKNNAESTVVVTYAARDSHNNVAKVRRVLTTDGASDGKEKTAETKDAGTETEKAAVVSVGRKNTERKDRKTEESETDTEEESESETEAETESESETEETEAGAPLIRLTENKAEIRVGDTFNALAYVANVEDDYDNIYSLWQDIRIDGEYRTDRAGTYTFFYYVIDSAGHMSNRARFTLTVKR